MLEGLIKLFSQYAQDYGYYVIFLATFLENSIFLGAIVPGETLALLAGFFASQKILDWRLSIVLLIVGAVLGDNVGFRLGRWKGKKWLVSIGSHFGYREEKIEKSEEIWKDFGGKAIFFGRFMAWARTFVPFLAGASKLSQRKFIIYDFLGATVWACLHVGIGYFFGDHLKTIEKSFGLIGVILLIIFAVIVYKYLTKKGIEKVEEKIEEKK